MNTQDGMDELKKAKEKVQGMAARSYIGIDMAAGKDMTIYAGQQIAQKPTEASKGQQTEKSAQETQKGQETASGKATDMVQEWLTKLPEEKREQQAKMLEEFCEKNEVTMEKLASELLKAAEQIKNVWEEFVNRLIRPAIEYLAERLQEYFSGMDKWKLEKMKMTNNDRRRRGLPMVRRQAHVRNIRNGRKNRRR